MVSVYGEGRNTKYLSKIIYSLKKNKNRTSAVLGLERERVENHVTLEDFGEMLLPTQASSVLL